MGVLREHGAVQAAPLARAALELVPFCIFHTSDIASGGKCQSEDLGLVLALSSAGCAHGQAAWAL